MDGKALTPGERLVRDARAMGFKIKDEKHPLDGRANLAKVMDDIRCLFPDDCPQLSARKLAKLCGLPERTLQRNMRGDSEPTAETLAAIVDGIPLRKEYDREMVLWSMFYQTEHRSTKVAALYCAHVLGALAYCGVDLQDLLSLTSIGLALLSQKKPEELNDEIGGRLQDRDAARFLTRDHGAMAVDCAADLASTEEVGELYKAARAIAPNFTNVEGEGVIQYSDYRDD